MRWEIFEKFSWSALLEYVFHSHSYPGDLEKRREEAKNGVGLGKSILIVGIDGFRRNVTKRGNMQDKERGGCLMGWCQWARVSSFTLG